jgi:hypothetical protein
MGVMLATLVSIRWAHLPERQFKVLNRMALMALDKPNSKGQPASIYFGGWEPLSLALNREVPEDDGNPGNTAKRRSLCHEVTKITTALVKSGALKQPVDKARRGHQQSWMLTLG